MKVAIQGHPTRGKEVIQILESLGGRNGHKLCGNAIGHIYHYHIDNTGNIIALSSKCDLHNYKFYTLEEFEKEFPFKIGEVVFTTVHSTTFKGVVKNINFNDTIYPYDCSFEDSGKCSLGGMNVLVKCETNQLFKMKEERNITLTLEKAKEWYNKGGELKEIALQAFTEEELNPLPRSWEEFAKLTKFTFISNLEYIDGIGRCSNGCLLNKSIGESHRIWAKYVALFQLEQLRNCWWNGWEPNWNDDQQTKYCVVHSQEFKIHILYETRRFLSFPTIEMAEEFLECFRDLIEKAGDLI